MENRKFVFKVPSSNSIQTNSNPVVTNNFNKNVNNLAYTNTSNQKSTNETSKNIPFSIKNFANNPNTNNSQTSSIFNKTSDQTKNSYTNTNNKSSSNFTFNAKNKTNNETSDYDGESKFKPSKPAKETNNKVIKSINSQATLTNFMTGNKNATNSFKMPNVAGNSNITKNSNPLADETDDDWAPIEAKKPNSIKKENKKENTITNFISNTTNSSKTMLNFQSPKKKELFSSKPQM